jgi:hypothetical protein
MKEMVMCSQQDESNSDNSGVPGDSEVQEVTDAPEESEASRDDVQEVTPAPAPTLEEAAPAPKTPASQPAGVKEKAKGPGKIRSAISWFTGAVQSKTEVLIGVLGGGGISLGAVIIALLSLAGLGILAIVTIVAGMAAASTVAGLFTILIVTVLAVVLAICAFIILVILIFIAVVGLVISVVSLLPAIIVYLVSDTFGGTVSLSVYALMLIVWCGALSYYLYQLLEKRNTKVSK